MSEELIGLLDLPLAWRRVCDDWNSERLFVRPSHERALVEEDLETWLSDLLEDLRTDRYTPSSLYIVNAPKGAGLTRPGGCLLLRDQVVYAACLGACLERIHTALTWTDEPVDFSYPLSEDPQAVDWIKPSFLSWRAYATKSLAAINSGALYVILADVAGYYECLDIARLMSDLRYIGVPDPIISQLSQCLNRWSMTTISGRGVPQGFSSSDILGRFYLMPVDRHLYDRDFTHLRYVDDFRVFCSSLNEAKRVLVELGTVLRKRGLILQTAKSQIHLAATARPRIEGIQPIVMGIQRNFLNEAAAALGTDVYIGVAEADRLLAENVADAPIEIIRQAYTSYFLEATDVRFEKTLFRFLLNRMGKHKEDFAFDSVLEYLSRQPEETRTILRYLERIGAVERAEERMVQYLNSEEAVYPYQIYEIVAWRNRLGVQPMADLLSYVRQLLFDRRIPPYLRCACRAFIAQFGSGIDLERLEDSYSEIGDDLEKAEVVCGVRRMEEGRRNAFLARVANDGYYTARAVKAVRSNKIRL
jgi:hypothetical protein